MGFREQDLVQWIRQRAKPAAGVTTGIGDDAAIVDASPDGPWCIACDQTVENVHFRRDEARWSEVGHKALARNLSDLAAMGARPWLALNSLGIPAGTSRAVAEELLEGLWHCAEANETSIIGGDLCRTPELVSLDVTVIGKLEGRRPLLRSAAKAGDELWVTGKLGASREGHHLRFAPRWREAVALADSPWVHACMDLSDGLARDLTLLAEASGVGFLVEESQTPRRRRADGQEATWNQVLHDGEDFELLFTTAAGKENRWRQSASLERVPLTRIGCIVPEGMHSRNEQGDVTPWPRGGYEHQFDS